MGGKWVVDEQILGWGWHTLTPSHRAAPSHPHTFTLPCCPFGVLRPADVAQGCCPKVDSSRGKNSGDCPMFVRSLCQMIALQLSRSTIFLACVGTLKLLQNLWQARSRCLAKTKIPQRAELSKRQSSCVLGFAEALVRHPWSMLPGPLISPATQCRRGFSGSAAV